MFVIIKREFEKVRPQNMDKIEKESFESALPRLKKHLPNFPECVLEQWVYRHFDQFYNNYWFLGFDKLVFDKMSFNFNDIMEIKSKDLRGQDYWGDEFSNQEETRMMTYLAKFMRENKTWPKPIIVFDTKSVSNKFGEKFQEPFHLLEGHMRLAYMRALIRYKVAGVKPCHEVWVVTLKK